MDVEVAHSEWEEAALASPIHLLQNKSAVVLKRHPNKTIFKHLRGLMRLRPPECLDFNEAALDDTKRLHASVWVTGARSLRPSVSRNMEIKSHCIEACKVFWTFCPIIPSVQAADLSSSWFNSRSEHSIAETWHKRTHKLTAVTSLTFKALIKLQIA